jgi:hypothetical protein
MKDTNVIERERTPTVVREEVPLETPGGATVGILNDPVTPFNVVVEAVTANGAGAHDRSRGSRVLRFQRPG